MELGTKLLGIDPGLTASGFSLLYVGQQRTIHLAACDFLPLSSSQSVATRVALFHDFFKKHIIEWGVTDIAIETPFLGKNAQNFLKLGYLRGIIYLLSVQHNIPLHEFTPCQVKQAITGTGGASKEQVAYVLLKLFPRLAMPKKYDATDAVAVALCALWRQKQLV